MRRVWRRRTIIRRDLSPANLVDLVHSPAERRLKYGPLFKSSFHGITRREASRAQFAGRLNRCGLSQTSRALTHSTPSEDVTEPRQLRRSGHGPGANCPESRRSRRTSACPSRQAGAFADNEWNGEAGGLGWHKAHCGFGRSAIPRAGAGPAVAAPTSTSAPAPIETLQAGD